MKGTIATVAVAALAATAAASAAPARYRRTERYYGQKVYQWYVWTGKKMGRARKKN